MSIHAAKAEETPALTVVSLFIFAVIFLDTSALTPAVAASVTIGIVINMVPAAMKLIIFLNFINSS